MFVRGGARAPEEPHDVGRADPQCDVAEVSRGVARVLFFAHLDGRAEGSGENPAAQEPCPRPARPSPAADAIPALPLALDRVTAFDGREIFAAAPTIAGDRDEFFALSLGRR